MRRSTHTVEDDGRPTVVIFGGMRFVVNARCGLMSYAPRRRGSNPPTGSDHADDASMRRDRFAELPARNLLGTQPGCVNMSPGSLVFHRLGPTAKSPSGADTILLVFQSVSRSWSSSPVLRNVATDRVDGDCQTHKRPAHLVIMRALLHTVMGALTRSVRPVGMYS